MNNSLTNNHTLASNFPTDCRIPHLENNPYIYGGGPPYKPHPCTYSPPKPVPRHQLQENPSNSSPYRNSIHSQNRSSSTSKPLRSTNPTLIGQDSSNSPTKEKLSGYDLEKRLDLNEKSSDEQYRTPKDMKNSSNTEKIEYNEGYSKLKERSGGSSNKSRLENSGRVGSSSKGRGSAHDRMQEYQLLNSNYHNESKASDEKLKEFLAKDQFAREREESERNHLEYELILKQRHQEALEKDRLEREKHLLMRKQQEDYERDLKVKEQKEYEQYLIKKQEEYEREKLLKERALLERSLKRKHQEDQENLKEKLEHERQQKEYERQKLARESLEHQRSIEKQQREYELEKLAQEKYLREQREKEILVRKQEEIELRLRRQAEERQVMSRAIDRSVCNDHETLKEQIGRESRQFLREKELRSRNTDMCSPERNFEGSPQSQMRGRENAYSETKPQVRNSSRSVKEKLRSLSNKKSEAHHFQQTFSTKVKFMANQPYTFAGSTKSTFSRHF